MTEHTTHAHGTHTGHGDKPDVHGMLVVGEETVFLSHLPMFDHPHHDYQVILQVSFAQPSGDPQAVYVNDRRAHPETRIYTLVPERFVLHELVSTDPERPPRRSFRATVFRGHFERGGTSILENVEVNVERVVHFRRFEPLAYLLFGDGEEHFLAHLITKPPDFDQVLSVQVTGHQFSPEALARGVRVTTPDRVNSLANRLRENERVAAHAHLDGPDRHEMVEIQVDVGREFYFEEGELRSPPIFSPTPEEEAAGF